MNKKFFKIISIFLLLDLTYTYFSSFILNFIDPAIIESQTEDLSKNAVFVISIILAPIGETFFSQILLYHYPKKMISEKFCFHFSALFFGLLHCNSIYLILALIPVGYFYMILYKVLLKFGLWPAYLGVVLVHMLSNLNAFIHDYYIDL